MNVERVKSGRQSDAVQRLDRIVIGAFLLNQTLYWKLGHLLTPAMLSDEFDRRVLTLIGEQSQTGNSFSVTAIGALYEQRHGEDERSRLFLAAQEARDEGGEIETYIHQIIRGYQKRELMKMCAIVAESVRKDVDPEQIASDISTTLDNLHGARAVYEYELSELMAQEAEQLDAVLRERDSDEDGNRALIGESWGLRAIDEVVGPIQQEDLIVVGGASGGGKTALITQLCRRIARANEQRPGKRVLFFALDQQPRRIAQREIAAAAGVSVQYLRTGQYNEADVVRAIDAASDARNDKLTLIRKPGMSWREIRARVLAASRLEPLGLVVIDHLKSVRPDAKSRANGFDVILEVMLGARELTSEAGVAIIVLSQYTRGSQREGQKPTVNDLYGGGVIEETADNVLLMWRPELASRSVYIINGKNRSMPLRDEPIAIEFIGESMRFVDPSGRPEPAPVDEPSSGGRRRNHHNKGAPPDLD